MSTFFQKLHDIIRIPATIITKLWRPLTCAWISAAVFVNGVYLPLQSGTPADMVALAGLVTAVTAAFAVREWGKVKGTAE